jgi:hypothetical protein
VDWSQRPRSDLVIADLRSFANAMADPRWDDRKLQQVADEINQLNRFDRNTEEGNRQAMDYYRRLSNDSLRVLASLPAGNEHAFTQLTIKPQDPNDPVNANRIGPDNPPDFHVDPTLRAYIDILDGSSTNRYFYRAAYVDNVNNPPSQLSFSSPPVWLPNVVPPRAPVITKVLGGDRKIIIKWASNRESDLIEYRLYRTESESASRDQRIMSLVHTESVPPGDPTTRPAEVTWTDNTVAGLTKFYYRLVAVDAAYNMSRPSPSVIGRAFDDYRPLPPSWNSPQAGSQPGSILLSWSSSDSNLACLVQRDIPDTTMWENVSPWLPRGIYNYTDTTRIPGITNVYRLKVRDTIGRTNRDFLNQIVGGEI